MRWVLAASALLAAAALAGCAGTTSTTTGDGTTATGTQTGGTGTTTSSAPPAGTATAELTASVEAGEAPLNVTFQLRVSGGEIFSWTLNFGDGSSPLSGTTAPPASETHTYSVGGDFQARFNVTFKDKRTAGDTATIKVTVPDAGPPPPSHFEFGSAAGCAGDILAEAGHKCISYDEGPSAQAVDGHWVPLDSRYWGKSFTSAMTPEQYTDTDCEFVASDAETSLGEAHNGAGPCQGVVPLGAAWIFIYSYAAPHQTLTVDFTL
jgi:PKD repeat protein